MVVLRVRFKCVYQLEILGGLLVCYSLNMCIRLAMRYEIRLAYF